MKTLIFLVGFGLVGATFWVAVRRQRDVGRLFVGVAERLGLTPLGAQGNRLFQFPGASGIVDGLPVYIGSVHERTRFRRRHLFFLQVVVGRHPEARVGPMRVGRAAKGAREIPWKDVVASARDVLRPAWIEDARTRVGQGGQTIDVYPEVLVRTFLVSGIESARWARRVEATVRVLVAAAVHHLPAETRGRPLSEVEGAA